MNDGLIEAVFGDPRVADRMEGLDDPQRELVRRAVAAFVGDVTAALEALIPGDSDADR